LGFLYSKRKYTELSSALVFVVRLVKTLYIFPSTGNFMRYGARRCKMNKQKLKLEAVLFAAVLVALVVMAGFFGLRLNPVESSTVLFLIPAAAVAAMLITEMPSGWLSGATASSVLALAVAWFLGGPMVHSDSYQSAIKTGESFEPAVFERTEVRTVSRFMATKKATKVLGAEFEGNNISSQFQLGEGQVLVVKGTQEWIFPLEYKSVFKWMSQEQIPGFVKVSATNVDAEAELVISPFKVSKSAWFHESIGRKAWWHGLMRPTQSHFEVDEDNKPHYVTVVIGRDHFYSKDIVLEVLVFDAVTGEHTAYAPENVPEWVDIVYPESLIEERLDWNGEFVEGFINSITAQNNVQVTTVTNLWNVMIDGKQYYYTGMTSPSSTDDSLITARLVDPRTNTQYIVDGVSGFMDSDGALVAVDSQLGADSARWYASIPVLRLIDGEYFYFATIISDSGIYQKSAAIKANNPSKVYFGDGVNQVIAKVKMGSVQADADSDETVTVSKQALVKILQKIEELNELKKLIQ